MNKLFLVTHPDCGYCKIVKAHLKERIESGEIGVIDAGTDEGFKIVTEDLELTSVPNCAEQDENGNYRPCELSKLLEENGK